MKKILAVLLAVFTLFALVGCQKKEPVKPQVNPSAKSEGTMTYAEYVAAELNSRVVIEGFVQATQSYWNGASLYIVDGEGGYFVYNGDNDTNISQQEWERFGLSSSASAGWTGIVANPLKVHVEGFKSEWAGEVEITDAVVTIVEPEEKYVAPAVEITNVAEQYAKNINNFVKVINCEVVVPAEPSDGKDLYFDVKCSGEVYTFCIESYLNYADSQVYNDVLGLKAGDIVSFEGFAYMYEKPQLHITKVVK